VLESVSWDAQETGRRREGVEELDAIVGKGHGFQTVKSLKLFKKIIQLWCPPGGLVMDPHAGSGTAGHAVLVELNEETGADRRFILIEQGSPESGAKYARSLTSGSGCAMRLLANVRSETAIRL
jgi:adenine-specific DNA-methyltransferase